MLTVQPSHFGGINLSLESFVSLHVEGRINFGGRKFLHRVHKTVEVESLTEPPGNVRRIIGSRGFWYLIEQHFK